MLKKLVLVTAVFVLILGLMAVPASAKWPKKAIQLIIPWPAGSLIDSLRNRSLHRAKLRAACYLLLGPIKIDEHLEQVKKVRLFSIHK